MNETNSNNNTARDAGRVQTIVSEINHALRGKRFIVCMNNGMSSDPARFYFPGLPADFEIPHTTIRNSDPVRVERQWPELFDDGVMLFMHDFRERQAKLTKENMAAFRASKGF